MRVSRWRIRDARIQYAHASPRFRPKLQPIAVSASRPSQLRASSRTGTPARRAARLHRGRTRCAVIRQAARTRTAGGHEPASPHADRHRGRGGRPIPFGANRHQLVAHVWWMTACGPAMSDGYLLLRVCVGQVGMVFVARYSGCSRRRGCPSTEPGKSSLPMQQGGNVPMMPRAAHGTVPGSAHGMDAAAAREARRQGRQEAAVPRARNARPPGWLRKRQAARRSSAASSLPCRCPIQSLSPEAWQSGTARTAMPVTSPQRSSPA